MVTAWDCKSRSQTVLVQVLAPARTLYFSFLFSDTGIITDTSLTELTGSFYKWKHVKYIEQHVTYRRCSVVGVCVCVCLMWLRTETPPQSHWKSNSQNPIIQIESQSAGLQFYLFKSAHRVCYSHFPLLSEISVFPPPFQLWFLLPPQCWD